MAGKKKSVTDNKKFSIDDIEKKSKAKQPKNASVNADDIVFIGLGGSGNNLLGTIAEKSSLVSKPEKQCYYVNFSKTDLSARFKGHQLLLQSKNGEGTGKSLEKGIKIVKENIKQLTDLCERIYKDHFRSDLTEKKLVIISSIGGGTGSSLTPVFLDYFSEFENVKVTYIGVLSARSEGVTTLPNALLNFENVYNEYALTGKVKSMFLFDNEKFQNDEPYDFSHINEEMLKTIEELFDYSFAERSSFGWQAIDMNEKKRVKYFGRGLSDFTVSSLMLGDVPSLESSVINEKFDLKKTKAAAVLFSVRHKEEELKDQMKKWLSSLPKTIKKSVPDAFFVFGYVFNDKSVKDADCRMSVILNGLEFPKTMVKMIEKASKAVAKIKTQHEVFQNEADLSF